MKPSRGKPRRPPSAPSKSRKAETEPLDLRLGRFFLWLVVLVPPFLLASVAKEFFRQPKLLASEWLALASLVLLAWGLRRVEEVRFADLWRLPAVRIVGPLLLVATAGLATTHHPLHTREALIDLWIGAAALVGWSVAVRPERLLRALLWPAAALGLLGILQFHGLWQPLEFFGLQPSSRLAVTSLAGNPGDLGAYLVLPSLIGQAWLHRRLREGEPWGRPAVWGTAAALVIVVYALLITQTLAAIAALLLGGILLWGNLLPRRRAAALLAGGIVAVALVIAAVPPLRLRVADKAKAIAGHDLNWFLTGRLDGWRTAVRMLGQHPLTGVGHGAYVAEFVPAKLALLDRGIEFFPDPSLAVFSNAHNEFLTAGAEWGVPGLIAVAWGLWVLFTALRPLESAERAIAWSGTAALLVLALVDFPFHLALVAYPSILFLSWVLRPAEEHA